MKYGYFDDARREYVIQTPQTPFPWINYLGNEKMFGLVSNTGGGYAFYRDAKLRRLTRYRYNNIPADSNGRYFFIREQNGSFWSPTWQPVKTKLDKYSCRHGLGYTTIESEKNKLKAEITYFIPLGENIEIHSVKLTNTGSSVKKISLFSFLEFCLWNADGDDRNFQRNLSIGEVEIKNSFIYHKTEYRERRNHYAYSAVNKKVNSFDSDRDSFIGSYRSLENPIALKNGKCSNSVASGWAPCASFCLNLSIKPGKTEELVFALGYIEVPKNAKFAKPGIINKKPAEKQFAKFADPAKVAKALETLRKYWDSLLSVYTIKSSDERLARMVNIWNPYQCMVTFNMSRSASFFESGIGRGMGFRDSNQDLLGFVHQIPERAKERILDIAATQLSDGGAYHQYQPLTKRGNSDIGSNFNDDPLWLILGVGAYIRETGDFSILNEKVPFENNDKLAKPLLEHLFRSYRFTLNNLGPHKLPLIGRADWNDCLNLNCFSEEPDEPFQTTGNRQGRTAESLMIAGLFVYACKEFSDLLETIGDGQDAREVRKSADQMVQAVEKSGRDKEWFLRAYDFFGHKVGSSSNADGKIYIESQGWCVMAGIGAESGFARKALNSARKHLGTKHGLVLQDPPHRDYHVELGEVSSYPPGYKENGGIFCHNNPWIMIAETVLGNGDYAFDYYKRICPAYREDISDLHKMEPYVYSQMIAGKAAVRHGEAKNSWLTGTAAWNYVAISQHILGIRPGYKGLVIRPCLPKEIKNLEIERKFRKCTYQISISRGSEWQSKGIYVNGKKSETSEIPPQPGKKIFVQVVL
ncbi:MAG TPA: glycosyl transferase [Lentisphaeria bacterium]|nr:MAG: glycosyl transferase [Lentisphaerae bacterium GWF2_49_21]HBC86793.1 glycosyl transferase [Lentisphaeria bacterium]